MTDMSSFSPRGSGGGGKGGGSSAAASPVEDADSLRSRQYARVLDALSEGEIVGLVNGHQSIFLDDTPLQNSDGSYNFHDVVVYANTGTQTQDFLPGFSTVENEVGVGVRVRYGAPETRNISNANIDRVRVTVGIPRLTQQDITTGDLHGADVICGFHVQTYVSGVGGGFVEYPIEWQWLACDPNNSGAGASGIGCMVTWDAAGYVFYESNPSVQYRVEYKLTSAGTWTTLATDAIVYGSPEQTLVINRWYNTAWLAAGAYQIRVVMLSGDGTITVASATALRLAGPAAIRGKTTTRYQRAYNLNLPKPANVTGWDIRFYRHSVDSSSSALSNETWWDSYTEIIDAKLRYPNTALVGLSVDASQFNAIPRRAYDIKGVKVRIPDNYNPVTRVYTGTWSGNFVTAWTDNPAWCFYDLITNARYGLGEYIAAAQVDKWALYNIAKYCDALVPTGYGQWEPRFTCNLYLQTREEAFKVINDFASIFRAMAFWGGGAIVASQDRPADPVALFSAANVIDGLFNYEGTSRRNRHTVALVSWNDPLDHYRQKIEYVEDSDGLARYGVVQTEVLAMGCTSRGQAHRMGEWLLYSGRMETETVSFDIGLFDVRKVYPGAIIKVMDSPRAGKRWGGRIVAATQWYITLDALTDGSSNAIAIESGKTYTLSVQLPDGTIASSAVLNPASTNVTVINVSGFSAAPLAQAMWVLEETSLNAQLFRILSITEKDGIAATVTGLQHNASKYDYIDFDRPLQVLPITSISATWQAPVSGITTEESLYIVKGDIKVRLHVGWLAAQSAARYAVEYRLESGNWVKLPEVTQQSAELLDITHGTYTLRITAISWLGVRSAALESVVVVLGKTAPPPDVDIFLVSTQADGTRQFVFGMSLPPLDLAGYRIRYKQGTSATWESMIALHDDQLTASPYETNQLARGDYVFAVKAVDTTGHESLNASYIEMTIPDPRLAGVLEVIDEWETGWIGTKTDCHVEPETGYLKALDSTTWTTLPATWADWTRWCFTPKTPIVYDSETVDIGVVSAFTPLVSVICDGTPTITESHSDDGTTWSAYAATGTLIVCRYVKIRVSVAGAYPILYNVVTILDAKPVTEEINDLDTSTLTGAYRIGVGDIRLPITKSYAVIRRAQLVLQGVGSNWSWKLIDKDATVGPRIIIYHGGSPTDATIDASIGGL